jgi:hypothetical protein
MAKFQEALDLQIETLGLAAMDTLRPEKGEHIIDIGCGCGQTSLDLGSRVGAGAQSHRLRNIDTDASRRSIQWRLGPLHSSMRAVLGWLPPSKSDAVDSRRATSHGRGGPRTLISGRSCFAARTKTPAR